jgi:hypothetical protein
MLPAASRGNGFHVPCPTPHPPEPGGLSQGSALGARSEHALGAASEGSQRARRRGKRESGGWQAAGGPAPPAPATARVGSSLKQAGNTASW